jgi:hypothetical protein
MNYICGEKGNPTGSAMLHAEGLGKESWLYGTKDGSVSCLQPMVFMGSLRITQYLTSQRLSGLRLIQTNLLQAISLDTGLGNFSCTPARPTESDGHLCGRLLA